MTSFGEICRKYTRLDQEDIDFLDGVRKNLVYAADLGAEDVFIDCYDKTGESAVVIAHSPPQWSASLYKGDVVGQTAGKQNEPAVYHALETGVPVHDLKAITQEGRAVKQDVVPIQNPKGDVIAVLIREKDVSERLVKEKKFRYLADEREKSSGAAFSGGNSYEIALREAHHRVKNNLQLIVSLMRMQARNTQNEEVKRAFGLNIQRVLTVASIHDILTKPDMAETVGLKALIARISVEIQALFQDSRKVDITVAGDDFKVDSDTATSAAIVTNELVTNALQHGYDDQTKGLVRVSIQKGNRFATITVEDDGRGFDTSTSGAKSMGLSIVSVMVKDKLHGEFRIKSDAGGTKAAFDFETK